MRTTVQRMSAKPAHEPVQDADLRHAQDQFVQAHMRRIFLLIYRVVGSVEDAQDLTQETFIKALQRQEQVKDLEKAAHWLSRIATNTAIDFLRRRGRATWTALEDVAEPIVDRDAIDPEENVLRAEERTFLDQGLQSLTARERMALLLRDVEDLPAEEVAARLNCSKATVRSHIANARVKFRNFLMNRRDS